MSSSSPYESSEDDAAADPDVEPGPSTAKASASPNPSSHIQDLKLSSESVAEDEPAEPRSARGTRADGHEELLVSLARPSVEAYASVLAEMIDELAPVTTMNPENYSGTSGTQHGAVFWTDNEKETFFSVLRSKGKNGVREIANAIGSKSELEVQEFLRLLHRGMERQHLIERHSLGMILGDIPAASEIGTECCSALDKYAELLSIHEQYVGDVAGKKRYQDLWIIDRRKAAKVDEMFEAQNDKALNSSSLHLPAGFFDVENWLRLSERIFMNPGSPRLEDNWSNVGFADESPSMTADAFTDFYTLAVSVTRRLAHSSLFFAMSRTRSMRDHRRGGAKSVRSRDVKAALDVLGMKHSKFDFWIGLPRRCNLDVSDIRNRKGWQPEYMSYDDVEDFLSREKSDEAASSEKSVTLSKEEGGYTSDGDMDHSSSPSSSASSRLESDDGTVVNDEDDHAEELDRTASSHEELQLWKTLGRPPPAGLDVPIKAEDEEEKPIRRPTGQRKSKQELVDWRDRTLYRSDWEEYGDGTLDLYEELAENRRKRRRTGEQGTRTRVSSLSSDSDADSGSSGSDAADEQEGERSAGAEQGHTSESEQMDVDEDEASIPEAGPNLDADQSLEREAEHLNQVLEQGSREVKSEAREWTSHDDIKGI